VTSCEPEDGLLDLIASVQAARDGRRADLDVILANGCREHMVLAAVRLLRETADERGATPEEFRAWGMAAGSRFR
jgi:hypothetical protein